MEKCYLRRYGNCSQEMHTAISRSRMGNVDVIYLCSSHKDLPRRMLHLSDRTQIFQSGILSREEAEKLLLFEEVVSS
jgi:hypothetical protein